ncbi:30S ribosome-binding factor RbfA, partial [bacterium]|nr:30S ribosome-binding factor RbfA [candidate division CSSED10-310 bacterium]
MKNFRCERVADLITREISRILTQRISDPRLQQITITGTRVSRDIRMATVFYTVFTGEGNDPAVAISLDKAAGFIRRELGRTLELRYVPDLRFEYDVSLEHGNRIWSRLDALGNPAPDADPTASDDDPDQEHPADSFDDFDNEDILDDADSFDDEDDFDDE